MDGNPGFLSLHTSLLTACFVLHTLTRRRCAQRMQEAGGLVQADQRTVVQRLPPRRASGSGFNLTLVILLYLLLRHQALLL